MPLIRQAGSAAETFVGSLHMVKNVLSIISRQATLLYIFIHI